VIILPRQARDLHCENSNKSSCCLSEQVHGTAILCAVGGSGGCCIGGARASRIQFCCNATSSCCAGEYYDTPGACCGESESCCPGMGACCASGTSCCYAPIRCVRVRRNDLLSGSLYKRIRICQDRLGTNVRRGVETNGLFRCPHSVGADQAPVGTCCGEGATCCVSQESSYTYRGAKCCEAGTTCNNKDPNQPISCE
jgi:hypothetical protein